MRLAFLAPAARPCTSRHGRNELCAPPHRASAAAALRGRRSARIRAAAAAPMPDAHVASPEAVTPPAPVVRFQSYDGSTFVLEFEVPGGAGRPARVLVDPWLYGEVCWPDPLVSALTPTRLRCVFNLPAVSHLRNSASPDVCCLACATTVARVWQLARLLPRPKAACLKAHVLVWCI
jgi:hypothetical protein